MEDAGDLLCDHKHTHLVLIHDRLLLDLDKLLALEHHVGVQEGKFGCFFAFLKNFVETSQRRRAILEGYGLHGNSAKTEKVRNGCVLNAVIGDRAYSCGRVRCRRIAAGAIRLGFFLVKHEFLEVFLVPDTHKQLARHEGLPNVWFSLIISRWAGAADTISCCERIFICRLPLRFYSDHGR